LSRPYAIVLIERAWWHFQQGGLRAVWRQARRNGSPKAVPSNAPASAFAEKLGLQPGDWVQVKSFAEIQQTLDSRGAMRGLRFLPGMLPFCEHRFRVHKRLETLFLEESRQIRKMKNTVLLEDVFCDGSSYHCDRSCFYYWREAWLRKVDGPSPGSLHGLKLEIRS
jgi:hypothetical protein